MPPESVALMRDGVDDQRSAPCEDMHRRISAGLPLSPSFPVGVSEEDHTSNHACAKFATELSCSLRAPRPMKIEFTRQPITLLLCHCSPHPWRTSTSRSAVGLAWK